MRKKIYHKQNFDCLVFFKLDRPDSNHLNINFIKTTLKNIFSLKKSGFLHFNPKTLEVTFKTVQNTAKCLPITLHIYRQKNHFNLISVWSELMIDFELKKVLLPPP